MYFYSWGYGGVILYIVLCEVLLQGGAPWLTKTRGSKWVKELDYIYLAFGVIGILCSVNRIEQVRGRFAKIDILAPLVLYPVHVSTRKSFGLMTRKLSVTESRKLLQFLGTLSRKKSSVTSANCPHVA